MPKAETNLVTTVIGAENPLQLTGIVFRYPLSGPFFHGLSRRPGSRQRRQVHVLVTRNMRSGIQGAHCAIADEQETLFVQPRPDTIDDRNIQAIIGSLTR